MTARALRVTPRKNPGQFSHGTALMLSGCLAGIAVRGTVPVDIALGLCALGGLGVLAGICFRRIDAVRTSRRNHLAQERALARIAHRIDRHIPRGPARPGGPHHVCKVSERQFMPVAQSSQRHRI